MNEKEHKALLKLHGKYVGKEKLKIESFPKKIEFDIYDGYACAEHGGHKYDMVYPQLRAVKEMEELSKPLIDYINRISTKKIESVDEIGIIHCLIAYNTIYCDGVEIVPSE